MAFFNSAVGVLQTLVVALGAGLGIWGAINLLEGYGNDNPGAKRTGVSIWDRSVPRPSPVRVCSGMRSCLPGRELNHSRKHGRNSGRVVNSWRAAESRLWRFIPKGRPGRRC